MKLHLAYSFGGKDVEEDFEIDKKIAAAMSQLTRGAADLTAAAEKWAIEIVEQFYGDVVCTGLNADAVKKLLHPEPDSATDERKSYCRMFAAFVAQSPRMSMIVTKERERQVAIESKDSATADFIKGGIEKLKEQARFEARNLCRTIIRVFAAERRDPAAPDDKKMQISARKRIERTIAEYQAAIDGERGDMKLVGEQELLRRAVSALQSVLAAQPLNLALPNVAEARTVGAEARKPSEVTITRPAAA